MNTFNLLIAAIIAIALLATFSDYTSIFFLPTELSKHVETQLLEAQADVGNIKSITLALKPGQNIYARNLDKPTRTVAFACSTEACCTTLDNCTQPLSASGDRLKINASIKTTVSTRCVPLLGVHACTVYVGKEPAQLHLIQTTIPNPFQIQGPTPLTVQMTIQNGGENLASSIMVSIDLIESQIAGGVEKPVVVGHDEKVIETIGVGKTQLVELSVPVSRVGTYTIKLIATGTHAGFLEEVHTLNVIGNEISLCTHDFSKNEAPVFDVLDNVCRKKVFCTGCNYTYECRQVWEKKFPLEGTHSYDPERGEPTFAYEIWPPVNGNCS